VVCSLEPPLRVSVGGWSIEVDTPPLTLAWVLKDLRPRVLARTAGISDEEATVLEQFREQLVQRLLALSAP
jgi:hypothetical protein